MYINLHSPRNYRCVFGEHAAQLQCVHSVATNCMQPRQTVSRRCERLHINNQQSGHNFFFSGGGLQMSNQ